MSADFSVIDFLDFRAGTVRIDKDVSSLPALKQHYVQQAGRFADQFDTGIDDVYFSGEYPSVYFKRVSAFTPEVVRSVVRLQRKVWNQSKVPFLYVESDTEVRVYNCYETPQPEKDPDAELKLRLLDAQTQGGKARKDLETLQQVFGKVAVESGRFWQEDKYARQVDVRKRVDRALIDNIKKAREQLRNKGLKAQDSIIHDLLLRSLFILYLEDRGATDQAFYETYLPGATSYFHILADKAATYRLFEKLESAFNGNLCPVLPGETDVVTDEHLQIIKQCFWSDWSLSAQPTLPGLDRRIFNFKYIPIQVISEIYEDFLRKEVGEQQMAKTGAFYTPHALAEFILNQVLPYPSLGDTNYNIKTLDPTCGSGIFLVDTLNRLLDRWEYANRVTGEKLTFEIIKQIVIENIFGIEIEREAIKVAAFSIYLTMLDRLDPKTLWQNNHFPYLIYNKNRPNRQQGNNLFCMSSLADGPFVGKEYDLVVGNPPFTNKVSPEVEAYIEQYGFGTETVIAFLHRSTILSPKGKIALVSTSKVLFNYKAGFQKFRHFLFKESYVEKIFNFSVLRRVSQEMRGRNLFASAVRPVCVLIYSKEHPVTPSEYITYYTPTTAVNNRFIDGIVIDSIDEKSLPRYECEQPNTKIWKAAMWGTERDFQLLKKLRRLSSLEDYFTSHSEAFKRGVGFKPTKATHIDYEIQELPHITAKHLGRFVTNKNSTVRVDFTKFDRLGAKEAFKAPHVIFKEGQSNKRFCASYLDFDCSFRNTLYGVHSPDFKKLKVLTAYLNSNLATYLLFLTASDWGVERERVNPVETLDLPDLCFNLPENAQDKISSYVDEIAFIKNRNQFLSIDEWEIKQIELQIEEVLLDNAGLSTTERILVDDLINYRLKAFEDKRSSHAFRPVLVEHSRAYATNLCQTINRFLQPGDSLQARAEYYDVNRITPLQVIILHLDEQKRQKMVEELPAIGIDTVLRSLENYTYQEEAESIYFRRFIRYYNNNTIYIVKPNEQRFWSRSMALNDADEIILEILTSEV